MPLVVDVSRNGDAAATDHIWRDCSFKSVADVLPAFVDFYSTLFITVDSSFIIKNVSEYVDEQTGEKNFYVNTKQLGRPMYMKGSRFQTTLTEDLTFDANKKYYYKTATQSGAYVTLVSYQVAYANEAVPSVYYERNGSVYSITSDETFQAGKTYYVYNKTTQQYDTATVTVGDYVPKVYYEYVVYPPEYHKLTSGNFTSTISYFTKNGTQFNEIEHSNKFRVTSGFPVPNSGYFIGTTIDPNVYFETSDEIFKDGKPYFRSDSGPRYVVAEDLNPGDPITPGSLYEKSSVHDSYVEIGRSEVVYGQTYYKTITTYTYTEDTTVVANNVIPPNTYYIAKTVQYDYVAVDLDEEPVFVAGVSYFLKDSRASWQIQDVSSMIGQSIPLNEYYTRTYTAERYDRTQDDKFISGKEYYIVNTDSSTGYSLADTSSLIDTPVPTDGEGRALYYEYTPASYTYNVASGSFQAGTSYFKRVTSVVYTEDTTVVAGQTIPQNTYFHRIALPTEYELTNDAIFISGKSYFKRNENVSYVVATQEEITHGTMKIYKETFVDQYDVTEDSQVAQGKTYYETDTTTIYISLNVNPGSEILYDYVYEKTSNSYYVLSDDTTFDSSKTYYTKTTTKVLSEDTNIGYGDEITLKDGEHYKVIAPTSYHFEAATGVFQEGQTYYRSQNVDTYEADTTSPVSGLYEKTDFSKGFMPYTTLTAVEGKTYYKKSSPSVFTELTGLVVGETLNRVHVFVLSGGDYVKPSTSTVQANVVYFTDLEQVNVPVGSVLPYNGADFENFNAYSEYVLTGDTSRQQGKTYYKKTTTEVKTITSVTVGNQIVLPTYYEKTEEAYKIPSESTYQSGKSYFDRTVGNSYQVDNRTGDISGYVFERTQNPDHYSNAEGGTFTFGTKYYIFTTIYEYQRRTGLTPGQQMPSDTYELVQESYTPVNLTTEPKFVLGEEYYVYDTSNSKYVLDTYAVVDDTIPANTYFKKVDAHYVETTDPNVLPDKNYYSRTGSEGYAQVKVTYNTPIPSGYFTKDPVSFTYFHTTDTSYNSSKTYFTRTSSYSYSEIQTTAGATIPHNEVYERMTNQLQVAAASGVVDLSKSYYTNMGVLSGNVGDQIASPSTTYELKTGQTVKVQTTDQTCQAGKTYYEYNELTDTFIQLVGFSEGDVFPYNQIYESKTLFNSFHLTEDEQFHAGKTYYTQTNSYTSVTPASGDAGKTIQDGFYFYRTNDVYTYFVTDDTAFDSNMTYYQLINGVYTQMSSPYPTTAIQSGKFEHIAESYNVTQDSTFQLGKTYYTKTSWGTYVQAQVVVGNITVNPVYYNRIADSVSYIDTTDTHFIYGTRYFINTVTNTYAVYSGTPVNPHDTGLCEFVDDVYSLTNDTEAKDGKTYYIKKLAYSAVQNPSTASISTYYERTSKQASYVPTKDLVFQASKEYFTKATNRSFVQVEVYQYGTSIKPNTYYEKSPATYRYEEATGTFKSGVFYCIKQADGTYVDATSVSIGSTIPVGVYYIKKENDPVYFLTSDTVFSASKAYYRKSETSTYTLYNKTAGAVVLNRAYFERHNYGKSFNLTGDIVRMTGKTYYNQSVRDGHFALTSDTSLIDGKTYYMINQNKYVVVSSPSVSSLSSYYEKVTQFIPIATVAGNIVPRVTIGSSSVNNTYYEKVKEYRKFVTATGTYKAGVEYFKFLSTGTRVNTNADNDYRNIQKYEGLDLILLRNVNAPIFKKATGTQFASGKTYFVATKYFEVAEGILPFMILDGNTYFEESNGSYVRTSDQKAVYGKTYYVHYRKLNGTVGQNFPAGVEVYESYTIPETTQAVTSIDSGEFVSVLQSENFAYNVGDQIPSGICRMENDIHDAYYITDDLAFVEGKQYYTKFNQTSELQINQSPYFEAALTYYEKTSNNTYVATTDTVFTAGKTYYILHGGSNFASVANIVYGEPIPDTTLGKNYFPTTDSSMKIGKVYYIQNGLDSTGAKNYNAVSASQFYEHNNNGYFATTDYTFQEGTTYYYYNGSSYVYAQVAYGAKIPRSVPKDVGTSIAPAFFEEVSDNSVYVRTTDSVVSSGKTYYEQDKDGNYILVDSPVVGNEIPRVYFEQVYDDVGYIQTNDANFVAGKNYYTKNGEQYNRVYNITVGAKIFVTYYEIGSYNYTYSIYSESTFHANQQYFILRNGTYVESTGHTEGEVVNKEYYIFDGSGYVRATGIFQAGKTYYRLDTSVTPPEFVEDDTVVVGDEIQPVYYTRTISSTNYVITDDTTVERESQESQTLKRYFYQNDNGDYVEKTGLTFGQTLNPDYYEQTKVRYVYKKTTDAAVVSGKTYYVRNSALDVYTEIYLTVGTSIFNGTYYEKQLPYVEFEAYSGSTFVQPQEANKQIYCEDEEENKLPVEVVNVNLASDGNPIPLNPEIYYEVIPSPEYLLTQDAIFNSGKVYYLKKVDGLVVSYESVTVTNRNFATIGSRIEPNSYFERNGKSTVILPSDGSFLDYIKVGGDVYAKIPTEFWQNCFLTSDERFLSGKDYYIYNSASHSYVKAQVTVGALVTPPNTYYEMIGADSGADKISLEEVKSFIDGTWTLQNRHRGISFTANGKEISSLVTPIGSMEVLIEGDSFDSGVYKIVDLERIIWANESLTKRSEGNFDYFLENVTVSNAVETGANSSAYNKVEEGQWIWSYTKQNNSYIALYDQKTKEWKVRNSNTSEDIQADVSFEGWKVELKGNRNAADTSLYDEAAIKNSITNLFAFMRKERIILPEYGNTLYGLIGSSITDGQMIAAKEAISMMFGWERRAKLLNVDIVPDKTNNQILIQIEYSIPELNITKTTIEFLVDVNDY